MGDFGTSSYAVLASTGWTRDTRDSGLIPTRGRLQAASIEATLPVGELRYWRATYNHQWYVPLSRDYTLALAGDFGAGRGFAGRPYPLFKNFYAGGIGSVRGFSPFSLGPRDPVDLRAIGGQTRIVLSTELSFPIPGSGQDRTFRSFVFFDAGNVYPANTFDIGDLRYSTGVGVSWISPFGPLKIGLGFPLRTRPGDQTQRIQFQIGTGF